MRRPTCWWRLPALFLLIALPLCCVLPPLIPPSEAPDENVQVLRADSLLYGDLTGVRTPIPMPDGAHLEALLHEDPALNALMVLFRGQPDGARVMSARLREQMRALRWSAAPDLFSGQTAPYPPVFYLPAAAGLAIGRSMRMLPVDALVLARQANAAAFLLIGSAALAVGRRARCVTLVTLALPMSLWLASSVHPDAPMLAVLALAVALLGRTRPDGAIPLAARWAAALCLGCVIALKPPLFPLAGMLLLPLRRGVGPMRPAILQRAGASALALALGLGWAAYGQMRAAIPLVRGPAPYVAGPLYPGPPGTTFRTADTAAQARTLLARPFLVVSLPLRTMAEEAAGKGHELIGVLGQLDLPLPRPLRWLWAAALALAAVADTLVPARQLPARQTPAGETQAGRSPADEPPARDPLGAALVLAIVVASVFSTYLALYLTWTPVGAERIEGVQGRYFLPLLPVLALGLPAIRSRFGARMRLCADGLAAVAGLASLAVIPALTVQAFYLR